ncbi:MAG: FAD-dependent oxidoreductase [Rhizobiaceae bacterium]
MTESPFTDMIIIGAGIAGASVAAELAQNHRVMLLEMENQPGYHTTGRSTAMFVPSYGPPPIRALTRASASFFHAPPAEFEVDTLLSPRPVMIIARHDQLDALQALKDEVSQNTEIQDLSADQMNEMNPLLKPDYAAAGILDVEAYDIDVAALHQGFLRQFKQRGGQLITNCRVEGLERNGSAWKVVTNDKSFHGQIIINAAGAWADEVNGLAGMKQVGLIPKRRTMVVVEAPNDVNMAELPLTIDVEENFFLKPEIGQFLLSPADETPSAPCDAQPDELDIAIAVDRIDSAFTLPIQRIQSSWAGLRSFVADKVPAVGFLDDDKSFFLLAGQGGYGIQTSPALSRLAAALVCGATIPDDSAVEGVTEGQLSPHRFD